MEVKKEDKIEIAEAVEKLNTKLRDARDNNPPPKRIGLIWSKPNSVLVLDIDDVEVFYGDLKSITIKATALDIIHEPMHLDMHNIIRDFLEGTYEKDTGEGSEPWSSQSQV
jgi:hypothetical protein